MALAYVALAWAGGLIAADRLSPVGVIVWIALGVGGAAGFWLNRDIPRWRLIFALLAAFGFSAARMAAQPRSSAVADFNNTGGATIEGVVIDPPDVRDTRVYLRIDADTIVTVGFDQPTSGLVLVDAPPLTNVEYGDRVRVTGRLTEPQVFDTFDYSAYLARRGVFSLIRDVSEVQVVSRGHGSPLVMQLIVWRDSIRETINRYLPEPSAGLLAAVLTGDERGISSDVDAAYADSGLAHLLAVSGFNMTLVAGFALALINRSESRRWLWALLGIAAVVIYTGVVGFVPSASRAAVMAVLVLIGRALNRNAFVPVSLGFALIVMTAIDPNTLFDLGFQLSFAALLGITLFTKPLQRRFEWLLKPELPNPLLVSAAALLTETLIVTAVATALTTPLIALTFGRLSLASLAANALVVPVQAVVMVLGVLLIAFSAVPVLTQGVAWLALVPLAWTTDVARTTASLPVTADFSLHPHLVGVIFATAVGGSIIGATRPPWWSRLIGWARSRQVFAVGLLGLVSVLVLSASVLASQPDGNLHVWILDVGHSHAVLIQTPSGAQILVDGGRYPSRLLTAIGDRLPFNDLALDAVIITQPDPFDIGAVPAVLRRYDVEQVLYHGQPNLGAALAEVAEAAGQGGLTTVTVGNTLDSGDGVTVEVLHPQTVPDIANSLDEAAMVLRVGLGSVSFLLAGEANREAQEVLLAAGQWPLASVLVLPKHGGARSLDADFLDAVQPQALVIQTDRANLLGDPNPDVLALLPEAVPVYRTDRLGTLHFFTDGRELYIETER